ncbi:MAG: hypothetical protein H6579_10685, partial [Chitinophagales bacterium]|nr:hypothetical protein [Chitinophagales bacterium]
MNTETELTDYEKALHIASVMPRFFLGQEVETKDGKGIIVKLEMEWNGLYLSPERSRAVVWFSTANTQNRWVIAGYRLSELNVA